MLLIYLFIVIFLNFEQLVSGQGEYACTSNYCDAFANCPKFKCKGKNEMSLSNSTDCGCCHRCIKELEEGDECISQMTFNTPDTQCGPHLKCHKAEKNNEKERKGKSYCRKISEVELDGCERDAYNISKKLSQITTGKPIPECDEFGHYSPTQCKNGTLCHCVDTNGTRIFGTDTYDQKDYMDCLCSRQYDEVNRKLGKYKIDPVNFIRCKSNGNFEPFQMITNYTYCINTTSGEMLQMPVLKKYQDQLRCISQKSKYTEETKCIKEYKKVIKEMEDKKDDGYLVIGYDVPQCDIDGSYKPKQCLNDECFCVNKNGERYKDTTRNRNTKEAQEQECTCVRELELIRTIPTRKWDKVTELFSRYYCDTNGNYLPVQCTESVCYCVDHKYGYQTGPSVLKTSKKVVTELKDENKKPCWDTRFEEYFGDQFI